MFRLNGDNNSISSWRSFDSRSIKSGDNSDYGKSKLKNRILNKVQRWVTRSPNQDSSRKLNSKSLANKNRYKLNKNNDYNIENEIDTEDYCDLDSIVISEHEESIMSEVIRNRKQFESICHNQWDLMRNSNINSINSSSSLTLTATTDSGIIQGYIAALEMAELENRSQIYETNSTSTLKAPLTTTITNSKGTVDRMLSVRNPYRRMRLLDTVSYIMGPQSTLSYTNTEEDIRLGFANLPEQMHRKAVKKGFNFTLMVVGESGLGKSTLINSLFVQDLYKDREFIEANQRIQSTTQIEKRQIELDERGVKLRLTVVDTPGFGDAVNCTDCWKPIEDYIDSTFEQYFKDECGLNRKNIHDHRVHCCLYFISPYGHGDSLRITPMLGFKCKHDCKSSNSITLDNSNQQ